MTTICLVMIVKNEADVIQRCLGSVKPIINSWIIVDTGSTDGTQMVIQSVMQGIQGNLYERPWHNFGHNRSEALELARSWADYSLMMDADDYLEIPAGFQMPTLNADAYYLPIHYDNLIYRRLQLFNNHLPWRYQGVLHEYPTCNQPQTLSELSELIYHIGRGGSRSSDPMKYLNDAAILEAALQQDPSNVRYVFYLAQSYRDAGQLQQALTHYQTRVEMGGWAEEVYISLLRIAQLLEAQSNQEAESVWSAYLRAYQYRPQRAEALCDLARYCRIQGNFALAYLFAQQAQKIPQPHDLLFVDASVYQWRSLDEYAVAGYWIGNYAEAAEINQRLLTEGKLPETEVERIRKNLAFCLNPP